MIKKMLSLFKKQPAAQEPEQKPESLIDKYRNLDMSKFTPPPIDRAGILSRMFPRPVSSVKQVPQAGASGMAVAMDSSVSDTFSLMPSEIPDTILQFYGQHAFIGWQACAILRQNFLINLACITPSEDAMAADFRLTYAQNNKKTDDQKTVDDEQLQEIKRSMVGEYNISALCRQLNVNKKTFGIGLAIPVMADGVDMSIPFNIDGIKKGDYKGMTLVEPYWCAPQMDAAAASNPTSQYFYEPTWWRIAGKTVHRSWCIKVVNTTLPDILKPSYYYGGVPLTQMMYERVYAAEKIANEAPLLALTKRMLVADADIDNLLANPTAANEIVRAISYMRDNYGVWFKRVGDQVAQIDTSLGDFDALIMTQYQLAATIAQMPATKLLKTTPKGFNATGEYEWKDYAQILQGIQEHDFKPLIKRHLELYTKSELGRLMDIDVTFNPVDVPTDKEQAEVEEINSRVFTNYSNGGIISNEEVREIIRSREGSPFSTLPEVSADNLNADEEADELLRSEAYLNDDGGAMDQFIESEHPRDDEGKFSDGGGGAGGNNNQKELSLHQPLGNNGTSNKESKEMKTRTSKEVAAEFHEEKAKAEKMAKFQNESGEGYHFESPRMGELSTELRTAMKREKEEAFAAEWTTETTNKRREAFNAAIKAAPLKNGKIEIATLIKIQQKLGYTLEDIKKAKAINNIS